MSGYKTYLVAIIMAVLPVVTEAIGGIDWVTVLTGWGVPQTMVVPVAGLVAAAIMAAMRKITEMTTVKQALETVPPVE
jgi:hypothetical protein